MAEQADQADQVNQDDQAENETTPSPDKVVVIENLTKKFGEFTAVDNLSMTVERGRILGFIGPNGAGKTTTIKILVGLAKPTEGRAIIAGVDCLAEAHRIKKLVGYMPDRFGGYSNMRVREYLDFFGAAFKIPRKERRARIHEVLEITRAVYMQDRYVEALSHGMQQRVGIARTLLHDPEVLIFDEPANGLDPEARIEMRDLLLRLADLGKTLIVTSHILPELARICDQIGIISAGKLRAFGTMNEINEQLGQMRMVEIQLNGDTDLDRAQEIVKRELTLAEIAGSRTEQLIRFRANVTEDSMQALLTTLITEKIAISQFREVQTDLEDAFLTVTKEDRAKMV